MKQIQQLAIFILICCSTSAFSQVDSTYIDGEKFYIYPFRQAVEIHQDYWIAVDDDAFFSDPANYFREFDETPGYFTADQFYEADEVELKNLNKILKRRWKNYRNKDGRLSLGRRFVKQVRTNPYPLLEVRYHFDKEVIPPFGKIPNGKYVQLFEDFCLVDKKGKCQSQEPRIAAHFTIKNNAIDGQAVWMNLQGDTIKSGHFNDGLKSGVWIQNSFSSIPRFLYKWSVKSYKKTGEFDYLDTLYIEAMYDKGILHGNILSIQRNFGEYRTIGAYNYGEPSGNWRVYQDSTLLMNVSYADLKDSIRSHKPIIRTQQLVRTYEYEYNTSPEEYDLMEIPSGFYEIAFEKEPDVELEEENFQSHTLEYSGSNYYRDDVPERLANTNEYYLAYQYYKFEKDPKTEYVETRGRFIDSIGAIMKFDGAYELYYPNGQLYTRYIFENGTLKLEDTLFWDNGAPHDVIVYDADSNQYIRTAYDYDGLPFRELVYDSLGDFSHFKSDQEEEEIVNIDGLNAISWQYVFTYGFPFDSLAKGDLVYSNWDTLKDTLTEPLVLYKQWSGFDLKELVTTTYDPVERSLIFIEKSYGGNEFGRTEKTFTENFESWSGKSTWNYDDYKVVETASGILFEFKDDSIPQKHVSMSYQDYDIASDYVVYKNDAPYNGSVDIAFKKKRFKIASNRLKVSFTETQRSKEKFYKKLYKHLESASSNEEGILQITNDVNEAHGLNAQIYYELFGGYLNDFFNYDYGYDDFGGWGYSDISTTKNNKANKVNKIKGQMKDGKPHGTWIGYNKKGKILSEVHFNNGAAEGIFREFAIEPKASRWERISSEEPLPGKKTYYLRSTTEYRNGLRNGEFKVFNWNGDIREKGTFSDDLLDGEYIEKYTMAYSKSHYKEGALDGYVQTYLTLPYEDTVLLYDLNFQHGLLNGESVAYHINGRTAKRGFFLDGEPIEDYEAYDTLGFKYHYVKFKFGFPVEEKIWEENELSVRYTFNWQDSIVFDPSDITVTMSLQSLLYKLGYGLNYLEQEYYGRPRLIAKEGLEYHMTKYYPNDTIARDGAINDGKKIGHWEFYDYEGEFLYEVDYFDSIIRLNDSIIFKSKGILTDINNEGDTLYKAFIIEKLEKYDCAHTDHYEIRQLYTIWESNDSLGRMNGYVKNYYDNGVLQNEGQMKNGLPDGLWKFYDPFGKLNLMGQYFMGKRNGRWLSGDLGKKKYLGEICLNPDLPDLEKEMEYRENLLDVMIINYKLGKALNKQYYDLNMNKYSEYQNEESSR